MSEETRLSYNDYKNSILKLTKNEIIERLLPVTYYNYVFHTSKIVQKLQKVKDNIYFEYVLFVPYFFKWIYFFFPRDKNKKRSYCELKGFSNEQYYDFIFFYNMYRKEHLPSLIPVIKLLIKFKKKTKVLLITTRKNFENFKEISDLESLKNIDLIIYDESLFKLSFQDYLILKKKSKYLKKEIQEVLDKKLKCTWKYQFKEIFYRHINRYVFLEKLYNDLFRNIQGNTMVYTHLIFDSPLIDILQSKNIKKVIIQHGMITHKPEYSIFEGADEIILWGKYWEKNVKDKILPNTKTVICGCPKVDFILKGHIDSDEYKQSRNNILIISETHYPKDDLVRTFLLFVEKLVMEMNNSVKITIKLHPSENKSMFKKYWNIKTFEGVEFIQNTDLYGLIMQNDIIIGTTSTGLIEATLFDKPIVQIRCSESSETDWYKYGILSVIDEKDFISKIKLLVNSYEYWKKVIDDQKPFMNYCFCNIGQSSNKIARYLIDNIVC